MGAQLTGSVIQWEGQNFLLAAMPLGLGSHNVGPLHIATEGHWDGHATGPIEFTAEVFDAFIARFEAQDNPIGIDYDHRTFNPKAPDSTAAGWIQHLERRPGPKGFELWAVVEWTDTAAAKIRAGEYKFCSPAFAFESKDRKSGEDAGPAIKNVALTNLPFLDGQTPIQLSFTCAVNAADAEPPPPAQPAAAPSSEDTAAAEAQALSEQLTAFIDAVAKGAGVNRAAAVAGLNDMTDQITGQLREHLDADGVPQEKPMEPKDKPDQAAADKAKADAIEASAKANEQTILLSQIPTLRAELDAIKADRKAEKDAADAAKLAADTKRVDGMVACGALLDVEKADALWMLSADADRFERVYGPRMKNKAVPIGQTQAGAEAIDPAKATPADLLEDEVGAYHLLCAQPGWDSQKAVARLVARRGKTKGAARAATKVG